MKISRKWTELETIILSEFNKAQKKKKALQGLSHEVPRFKSLFLCVSHTKCMRKKRKQKQATGGEDVWRCRMQIKQK